jgi:hypothetical protein
MRPKATRFFALPVFGEGGVGLFAAFAPKEEPTFPSPKSVRESDG